MVAELRAAGAAVAWVRADNLHLTLRFLGEVEPAALERVREAMAVAATATAPFTVDSGGWAGFPSGRPPRVVWAGVAQGARASWALHVRSTPRWWRGAFRGRAGRSTRTSRSPAPGTGAERAAWQGCWARALDSGGCRWRRST